MMFLNLLISPFGQVFIHKEKSLLLRMSENLQLHVAEDVHWSPCFLLVNSLHLMLLLWVSMWLYAMWNHREHSFSVPF